MAPSKKPGPLGTTVNTVNQLLVDFGRNLMPALAGHWYCGPNVGHLHPAGSIGICPPWIRHPHPKRVDTILVHNFFQDEPGLHHSVFEKRITGIKPTPDDGQYHEATGYWPYVDVEFYYEAEKKGAKELKDAKQRFKASLGRDGAIVVYFGHSALADRGNHTYYGWALIPNHEDPNHPIYPMEELRSDLQKSPAALVLFAGCDIKSILGADSGKGPMLVVVDSGADSVSWGRTMSVGITSFLLTLGGFAFPRQAGRDAGEWAVPRATGAGTIGEALAAANRDFIERHDTDHFVLVRGDMAAVLF